jgi:hypothetical protein
MAATAAAVRIRLHFGLFICDNPSLVMHQVTLHKNRRNKHAMPVPSEQPLQQVPASLAQFASCRALVLDSSYRPIDVINWQRAICLDLFDKVRQEFPCHKHCRPPDCC